MKKVIIDDTMQKGTYYLNEAMGANFDPDFTPELSPKELLALGLFGGKYMTDCRSEFRRIGLTMPNSRRPKRYFFKLLSGRCLTAA